ncbi:MAG TPA: hypothetical protein VJ806_00225 [Luteimonas sp.]|nr:hypothetical protein [Luteimonas sp.]
MHLFRLRRFSLSAAAVALALVCGVCAGRPIAGVIHNRVEYTYIDGVGGVIGTTIYQCNGWVLHWGANSGAGVLVDIEPCD